MRCFKLKHVCRLSPFEAFAVCNVQPVVHPCMREALAAMTSTTLTTTTKTTTKTTISMEPSSLPSSSSSSIDATPSLPPVTPPPTSRRRFPRPSTASSSSPSPSSSRRPNPLWERATSAAASFLRRSDAVEIATSIIAVSICYQFHSFGYLTYLPSIEFKFTFSSPNLFPFQITRCAKFLGKSIGLVNIYHRELGIKPTLILKV